MPEYGKSYEYPKLKYEELPPCIDSLSLATTLGISHQTLWYFITHKKDAYRIFKIPKKHPGKFRTIHDPRPTLKWTQKQLLKRFLEKIPVGEHVGAFVPGKSCAKTAAKHSGKAVVICLDICDFFPSIRRAMIRRYFNSIGYNFEVSSLLADLMTAPERCVPQGAPTSGAISNIIADWLFDRQILDYLHNTDPLWEYSRYADDLIFSHPQRQDKEKITQLLKTVSEILRKAGFRIKWPKTKIRGRGRRQQVLGCTVNEKVNVPRQNYMEVRAMLHNVCVNGWDAEERKFKELTGKDVSLYAYLRGQLSYFKQVNRDRYERLLPIWEVAAKLFRQDKDVQTKNTNPQA